MEGVILGYWDISYDVVYENKMELGIMNMLTRKMNRG
jgi:hypothetical protein